MEPGLGAFPDEQTLWPHLATWDSPANPAATQGESGTAGLPLKSWLPGRQAPEKEGVL